MTEADHANATTELVAASLESAERLEPLSSARARRSLARRLLLSAARRLEPDEGAVRDALHAVARTARR